MKILFYNCKFSFAAYKSKINTRQFILEIFRRRSFNTPASENGKIWESVVGLEVHAQINAKSKLFSSSPSVFGSPTNTEVSFFDAALPGTLPVLNKYCVEAAIKTALALNCTVNQISMFDRKHYFYPDLPAGYQITQQFRPLASNGSLKFIVHNDSSKHNIPYELCSLIKQIQLEQDSGKTFHINRNKSFVDLNRAGIALMELVFEPDLHNGSQAAALVKELILVLKRVNTCTCEMEEGTLRVDANISVNRVGEPLGVRTEVKNINSLRYIARAIDYEIQRQIKLLENGKTVVNETLAYNYQTKSTVFMRDKEVLQDYRFMPEPNLPPLVLHDSSEISLGDNQKYINIDDLKVQIPALPEQERSTLTDVYNLSLEASDKLINLEGAKDKFEAIASLVSNRSAACDFLLNNLLAILNVRKLTFRDCPLTVTQLVEIIELIISKKITEATANDVLEMLLNGDQRSAEEIVKQYNWSLISDEKELEEHCLKVIEKCSKMAKKYRNTGKQKYMTSLLTMLYADTNNRAPYKQSEETFKRILSEHKNVK